MSVSVAIPGTRYVAPRWLQMVAATIGNALEHFHINMYGYLAVTLSSVFFPARNTNVSLLLVFASFGLPYVARPLGAIVLGAYGDRRGRKKALTVCIWLMMVGTAIIAFMPFTPLHASTFRLVRYFRGFRTRHSPTRLG